MALLSNHVGRTLISQNNHEHCQLCYNATRIIHCILSCHLFQFSYFHNHSCVRHKHTDWQKKSMVTSQERRSQPLIAYLSATFSVFQDLSQELGLSVIWCSACSLCFSQVNIKHIFHDLMSGILSKKTGAHGLRHTYRFKLRAC